MAVNHTIIFSVIILMATGVYHYFLGSAGSKDTTAKQGVTITRILVGGYMLAIFASIFEMVGFGVGRVAGWVLMLAVGASLYTVITDLYTRYSQNQAAQQSSKGIGGHPNLK